MHRKIPVEMLNGRWIARYFRGRPTSSSGDEDNT
jgi:hypothetical protein